MKTIFQRVLCLCAFLPLVACVETTAPLCDSTNKANVPGLRSSYKASMLQVDSKVTFNESGVNFTNKGPGEYEVTNSAGDPARLMHTCKVGGRNIAEVQTPFGTYQQVTFSISPDGTLTQNQLILDPAVLTAAGIHFEIVERQIPHSLQKWGSFFNIRQNQTALVLQIKNTDAMANEVIGKNVKPFVVGTTLN